MKAEEEFAARKAVRQETQQHINQDGQEQRLAPEAAQEAEEERPMHAGPCRTSHVVRRLRPCNS